MRKQQIIRLKLTSLIGNNISYITVKNGNVMYESAAGASLSLSDCAVQGAKELEFNLECCRSNEQAAKIARKFCHGIARVEVWQQERV